MNDMGIGTRWRAGLVRRLTQDKAWELVECLWGSEQEGAVSGDCFVVWQQVMYEEMGVMGGEDRGSMGDGKHELWCSDEWYWSK